MMHDKPVVLVGEDDPADRDLIRRALSKGQINLELVSDGEQVLDYIDRAGNGTNGHRRPDLIIVDLNMPRLDGRQVLDHLRRDQQLNRVPIVVFSSSSRAADICACYDAGCASYVVKPTDLEPFMGAVNLVVAYWVELVSRPGAGTA